MLNMSRNKIARRMHPSASPASQKRTGFTLMEVIIVIMVATILIVIAAPVMLSTREASRRNTCGNRIRQIWTALNVYHDVEQTLPAGVISSIDPVPGNVDGEFRSWLLPLLQNVRPEPFPSENWKKLTSLTSPDGVRLRQTRIPALLCPSDPLSPRAVVANGYFQSNYAGVHDDQATAIASDNSGLLILNERFRFQEIPDGSCCTLLVGELRRSPEDLGWAIGNGGTLRNTGTPINHSNERLSDVPGGFGSYHPGGCYFLIADGRLRLISESIDKKVYQQLANRADGGGQVPADF